MHLTYNFIGSSCAYLTSKVYRPLGLWKSGKIRHLYPQVKFCSNPTAIFSLFNAFFFLLEYLHLDVVRGLACSNHPEGYAGRSVKLLVGSPKPDRPKVIGQTKRDTPGFQRWEFVGQASNLPTVKKIYMLIEPVRSPGI
jgi:hypothetical protein